MTARLGTLDQWTVDDTDPIEEQNPDDIGYTVLAVELLLKHDHLDYRVEKVANFLTKSNLGYTDAELVFDIVSNYLLAYKRSEDVNAQNYNALLILVSKINELFCFNDAKVGQIFTDNAHVEVNPFV